MSLLLLILIWCTWSFSDRRSKGVSIRIRSLDITPIHDRSIDLVDESKWKEVKKVEAYGEVGIARLSQPHLARYVVVSRNGLINLKEVQIYQRTSEWLFTVGRYEVTQGRIVRSRTLECSRVKVLRVEHSKVNLFDGQLKMFESCLLFLFKKKRRTAFSKIW